MLFRFLKTIEKKYGKKVLNNTLIATGEVTKSKYKVTKPVDFMKVFNKELQKQLLLSSNGITIS